MTEPSYDITIVGGGFAGLSAATALAESGRRVLVLEARPSLGGRATSFVDPATGERVDNGQHLLIGGYHETFKFLRRIGAHDDVHLQPRLAVDFVDSDHRRSRLESRSLPAPLHLLAGIVSWSALGWHDRLAALRMGPAIARAVRKPSGATGIRNVRDWLQRHGQTPHLIELLWEPLAVATLNESIDVAAPEPFVHVLARMFGRRRHDASLGIPLKPLDALYADPARAFVVARHGEVRVNAPAKIAVADAVRVQVREEPLACRAIICAVPWYALEETIVPAGPLEATIAAARNTPASPIVTVNLWFDRQVMQGMFLGLPRRSMQWVFDKREVFGETASHLSLVSSGATDLVGRSNDEIIQLALLELRAALPPARFSNVRRAVVVRERRATFSVAPGLPDRPATQTAVPGLFLAGDWIDTGLPATIESAVVSGHAAAVAAAEFLDT